jgi:hypothetical protein
VLVGVASRQSRKGGVEVMQRGQHANFEPFGKIKGTDRNTR